MQAWVLTAHTPHNIRQDSRKHTTASSISMYAHRCVSTLSTSCGLPDVLRFAMKSYNCWMTSFTTPSPNCTCAGKV